MPSMGGETIGWDETKPANTDLVGQGDDAIRSILTNLRGAMASEHNWPSTGGANTGYHRPGSARPFVQPASRTSSTGTFGRLIFNSDDSSFWNSGAADASLIGHPGVLITPSLGNAPSCYSTPAKFYNVVQYGQFIHDGTSNSSNVTFASAYSGIPVVFCQQNPTGAMVSVSFTSINPSGFSAVAFYHSISVAGAGTATGSRYTINWCSIGSRSAGLP